MDGILGPTSCDIAGDLLPRRKKIDHGSTVACASMSKWVRVPKLKSMQSAGKSPCIVSEISAIVGTKCRRV